MKKVPVLLALGLLCSCSNSAKGVEDAIGLRAACKAAVVVVQTAQQSRYSGEGSYAGNIQGLIPAYLTKDPSAPPYAIRTDGSGKVFARYGSGPELEGQAGCAAS